MLMPAAIIVIEEIELDRWRMRLLSSSGWQKGDERHAMLID